MNETRGNPDNETIDYLRWHGLALARQALRKPRRAAETTHRTRKAIIEVVRGRELDALEGSHEVKDPNPFLNGIPAMKLPMLQSASESSAVA